MQEAIVVLEKAEAVLMKRIRAMRDGSPKWSAAARLQEVRAAIKLLKVYDRDAEQIAADNEAMMVEALTLYPPLAQA
jgi:hypothetical protein